MLKQQFYSLEDIDEVERMRQVRRDLEQQFPSSDKFFDWLEKLQRQHDERVASKETKRRKQEKATTNRRHAKRT